MSRLSSAFPQTWTGLGSITGGQNSIGLEGSNVCFLPPDKTPFYLCALPTELCPDMVGTDGLEPPPAKSLSCLLSVSLSRLVYGFKELFPNAHIRTHLGKLYEKKWSMMVYTFLTTQPKGDEVSSYIGVRSSYPLRDVILLLKKVFV